MVSAGLHDLFLDLPIEQARTFVEKKRQILQSEPARGFSFLQVERPG